MSSLVLQFNGAAVELLQGITRLRVNTKKRGGVEYLALRPSYRVSGKNMQARTAKSPESGATLVEIPNSYLKDLKVSKPELGASFLFNDEGYGWFTLRDLPEDATDATPTIIVADSALMKTAIKADEKVEADAEAKQTEATPAKKSSKTKAKKDESAEKPAAKKSTTSKSKAKKAEEAPQEAPQAEATQTGSAEAEPAGDPPQEDPQAGADKQEDAQSNDNVQTSSAEELAKHFGISTEEVGSLTEKQVEQAQAEIAAEAAETPAAKSAAKSTAAAVKKSSSSKKKDEGTQSA